MESKGKHVKAFMNRLKFEGIVVDEDNETYRINDKEGMVRLPKSKTVLMEGGYYED